MSEEPQKPPTRLLTPKEAALFLGISKRTLDRLVKQGVIAVVRLGGSRRFTMDDLLSTINRYRAGGYD